MSKIRLGINGMGRIGRTLIRQLLTGPQANALEITAVNNPGDAEAYSQLLKYDSVHGVFPGDVDFQGGKLNIGGTSMAFYGHKDPSEIPWGDSQVDIVIDATGVFKDKVGLGQHLTGSVKKVIMCAPGKDLDATFVFGVNHTNYQPNSHHIVSNASCTTNCLAPVAKIIQDNWGINTGHMTTVHSYTSDQNLLDGSHRDPRRARAAALSMIPTSTGAAKSVGIVLPELAGKLDGVAIRVPTPNVSMVDFVVQLNKSTSIEEVNNAMKEASQGSLKGVLAYNDLPLVGQDFMGHPASSIFDSTMTNVIDGNHLKIMSWYDNEVGFSNRVLDLANFIGKQL